MLRWLFLILLLCNLALFVWGYRQTVPKQVSLPPLPAGVSSILLLDEQPEQAPGADAKQPDVGPVSESEALPGEATAESERPSDAADIIPAAGVEDETVDFQPALICVRLGPLEKESAAFDVITTLSDNGHQTDLKVVDDKEQSGYWVLIAPGEEDPDFVVANLELSGFGDVWRFTKGELAGMVSLGLYSSRSEAEGRLQELSGKEFDAEIRPRHIDRYSYWIHTRYDPEYEPAATALDKAFNENPWLEYPPAACPDIASSEENP